MGRGFSQGLGIDFGFVATAVRALPVHATTGQIQVVGEW